MRLHTYSMIFKKQTSVSLAITAMPETIPNIVTIILRCTTKGKEECGYRKLPAVETLGSATVICSDKT